MALLGVGTVLVIDLDHVEDSNLARCVLFRESDEGKYKAEVAAAAVSELNPATMAVPIVGDVRLALGLGVFAAVDVVLGGLDNREARVYVNQACWKVGTPWVDGAIEGLRGEMRSFVPPDSACYECTLGERDYELLAMRRACSLLSKDEMLEGKVPTVATSSSIIAAMQVQEAVKLLHRDTLHYEFAGHGFAFNGQTHDSYVVRFPRRKDCLGHDTYNLQEAQPCQDDEPLGELLERGKVELADGAVLDLEHDVVLAMHCPECGMRRTILQPLDSLSAGVAECGECGGDCEIETAHSMSSPSSSLYRRSSRALRLPPFDVITVRLAERRIHFKLRGDVDPVRYFARGRVQRPSLPVWRPNVKPGIYAHVYGELHNEVGGVLIGRYGKHGERLEITGAIPAAEAEGLRASVTFTHEAWAEIHAIREEQYPDAQIVGWYHSHPGFGIFLSGHDLFLHRSFFSDPRQLAFVVDPAANTEGLFGWTDGEIAALDEGEVDQRVVALDEPGSDQMGHNALVRDRDRPSLGGWFRKRRARRN